METHANGFEICINATAVFSLMNSQHWLIILRLCMDFPTWQHVSSEIYFFLLYDLYFLFESSHWLLNFTEVNYVQILLFITNSDLLL